MTRPNDTLDLLKAWIGDGSEGELEGHSDITGYECKEILDYMGQLEEALDDIANERSCSASAEPCHVVNKRIARNALGVEED